MTQYEALAERWKVGNTIDEHRIKVNVFTKDETLPIINEKARMRGMSYGQYVLARTYGYYMEDALQKIKIKHEHRVSFMAHTKRR